MSNNKHVEEGTAMHLAVEAALTADREAALRDVFATAALGSVIVTGAAYRTWPEQLFQARLAYAYADAMLEARKT